MLMHRYQRLHSKAMGLMGDVDAKIDERKQSMGRTSSEPVILSTTGAAHDMDAGSDAAEVPTAPASPGLTAAPPVFQRPPHQAVHIQQQPRKLIHSSSCAGARLQRRHTGPPAAHTDQQGCGQW